MRVLELSLRNYRVFEEVDLELPARVIGIFGPNGGGKTALVESLLLALYGQARTGKDQIRTHGVLTDCEVRLVFQHGGQQYEVRRVIRGKNHQTQAELLVGGVSLAVGVREVDAEVRRLLRMDHQVFRASVFAEQKQLDAFSDLTRARRKEMVLRLLGIRPVDDARAAARKAAREAQGDAERLAGALPDLSEQEAALGGARETLAKAREAAREAEAGLRGARERLTETEEAFERSDRAREQAEKLDGLRAAAEEEARRLTARREELAGRIEALKGDVADLPALEQEAGALVGARDRLDAARTWADAADELRNAEAELEDLPEMDAEALLARREEAEAALRAVAERLAQAEVDRR